MLTNLLNVGPQVPLSVVDPGFPIGGRAPVRGGRGPLMQAILGENVCENERIGSNRGVACARHAPLPDPPMPIVNKDGPILNILRKSHNSAR